MTAALGNGKLLSFCLARACSALGDKLLLFIVPVLVFTSTGSAAMSGLAFTVEWVPRLASMLVAGIVSDRFGGVIVYRIADFIRALGCVLVAYLATHTGLPMFGLISVLAALSSICYVQSLVAVEATLPTVFEGERLATAQSVLQAIEQGSLVVGSALAAYVASRTAPVHMLWGVGALFAGSAALAWLLPTGRAGAPREKAPETSVLHKLALGFSVLASEPTLRRLVGFSVMVNLTISLGMSAGAPVLIGVFHQPAARYAYVQTTVGILAVIVLAVLPLLVRALGTFRLGIFSYCAVAFGGLLMALAENVVTFVAGFALAESACSVYNVFIRTERVKWIPKEQLGRVISAMILCNQAVLPLSGLLLAVYPARLPLQFLFALATLVSVLYLALNLGRLRAAAQVPVSS